MTPKLDLRDLDRRLVPAAAVALRRLLDVAGRTWAHATAAGRRRLDLASAASRRLDDRALLGSPLAVLREVPQLALVAVAAVFVAGTAAAVRLDTADPPAAATPAGDDAVSAITRLGPPPGSDVDLYLSQAAVVLDDVAARLPADRFFAVLHLERYVPAAEVPALLQGSDVKRLYLRASTAGPEAEILTLPVSGGTDVAAVLPTLCATTSDRKAQDASSFTRLADAITPTGEAERVTKADFAEEAARSATESQAFAGACATTFAAVVEAPAEVLSQLSGRDGVRGAEVAPAGIALADLDIEPLLPETTGAVPGRER